MSARAQNFREKTSSDISVQKLCAYRDHCFGQRKRFAEKSKAYTKKRTQKGMMLYFLFQSAIMLSFNLLVHITQMSTKISYIICIFNHAVLCFSVSFKMSKIFSCKWIYIISASQNIYRGSLPLWCHQAVGTAANAYTSREFVFPRAHTGLIWFVWSIDFTSNVM